MGHTPTPMNVNCSLCGYFGTSHLAGNRECFDRLKSQRDALLDAAGYTEQTMRRVEDGEEIVKRLSEAIALCEDKNGRPKT